MDLAKGHIKAIEKIVKTEEAENGKAGALGLKVYNLGTGNGYSVLDIVAAFSKACGKELPYVIDPRRAGDIDMCYADPALAKEELGWSAEYDLDRMCADTWRWQSRNPDGYATK